MCRSSIRSSQDVESKYCVASFSVSRGTPGARSCSIQCNLSVKEEGEAVERALEAAEDWKDE